MRQFTSKYAYGRWWSYEEYQAALERARIPDPNRMKSPMVIRDAMDDVLNPVNGLKYDSKRGFERAVKDAGCVIMGNDAPQAMNQGPPALGGVEEDIRDAIQQLEAGNVL